MKSFSTFIKYYSIICASLLIPLTSLTQVPSVALIDFDENTYSASNFDFKFQNSPSLSVTQKNITDNDTEKATMDRRYFYFPDKSNDESYATFTTTDFWTTLHSIESKQGRLLYRPSNKSRNCHTTSSPCGHHQLSLQALKDISCTSQQCKSDREDYEKSLAMSKQLEAINNKRLKKAGFIDLPEYQQYLIHQQGATGFKIILGASQGTKLLSRNMKKNMAGNSPYSYRKLRRFGSKLAAEKFLKHWEQKWQNEKKLIIAYQGKLLASNDAGGKNSTSVLTTDNATELPLFNDHQLQIALNIKIK